jgi:predicted RNA-binding protein Jag
LISLASSISSLNIDNNKTSNPISNEKQSINVGINVAISNDSGIHEDSLETNLQIELKTKLTKDSFQLPSWLANNQPIPDELLAKRSIVNHSTYQFEYDDDDDDNDPYQSSSFYAFSFIDFADDNEDTSSINSTNTPNTYIRDEIKTCVDTIHNCLNHFREMNEEIDENIRDLLNELIDQIEYSIANEQSNETETIDIIIDSNLLNELLTKKLTFSEYLILLDRLIDNKYIKISSKTSEELSNEILLLAEDIEQYRTIILKDHSNNIDNDNQDQSHFLPNTQSNHSVISFLQQSTSMDMSLLATNDLSNQIQSTIFTTSIQQAQQKSTTEEKLADIGRLFLIFFSITLIINSREICSISQKITRGKKNSL